MAKQPAAPPAIDPRRTYNDQVSEALSSRFVLSAVTLLALLIALGAIAGLTHVAGQSKFVPYVIERGCQNHTVAAGPARPADALDPAVISQWTQGTLANFLTNARLVTPDRAQQERAVHFVYAFLAPGDAARQRMNDWYNGDPPMERAVTSTVNIELSSVLAQSPDTWQLDWTERVSERDGSLKEEFRMRALVTVYRRASTRETPEEDLRTNPLGLFVKDFSWGRQL